MALRLPLCSAAVLVGLVPACADSGPAADSADGGSAVATGREVQAACDLLAALGHAIIAVEGASTLEEFRAGLDMPMRRYIDAAEETDDVELTALAATAQERYTVYLSASDPLDAREAGADVNVALDRSTRRCAELGATTVFPQVPR